jgi:hypothetical protein
MSAPDVAGILAALARLPGAPPERVDALVVSLDAVRSAEALRTGRRMPAPRRRRYSPSLSAYATGRRRNRLGRFMAALVALVVVALGLTGCATTFDPSPAQARPVSLPTLAAPPVVAYVPGKVTGAQLAPCHAQGEGTSLDALPDPYCTPGSVGTTKVDGPDGVCTPGFQTKRRAEVTRPRLFAMQAYGVRIEDSPVTEYDHRIPLSIGGSNDTSNLWPQRSDLVGKGVRNRKDSVEYTVWYAVCRSGKVALADAQRAFMGDWRDALRVLKLRAANVPAGVAAD